MKKILLYVFILLSIAGKVFSQNPGDTIFNSPGIHNVNIVLSQTGWWDSLLYNKQHADSFNLSTEPMLGNVIFDGHGIDSVGIQLKGNSSFGYPGRKKPIKISFNEFVKGKKLEGLTSINLNNNALDPGMMREKLMLDFMTSKGLPAPRCTYARVFYNGQYVGLYKLVEQVNKEFCKTHFDDWGGNLFKGDPGGTLGYMGSSPAAYYGNYELHSNNTANDWSDLVNLIDNICNTPGTTFYDTLETNLNTTPCIGQWAARNLFVDLDAYFHSPHNYYLYHNTTTNKFEWCTWDVSVSFGFYPYWTEDSTEKISLLMANPPLAIRMMGNSIYKTRYLNTICDYLDYFNESVLFPKIDSIAAKIYPSIVAEPDSNQMFPEQMFYASLDTFTFHSPIGDIPGLKKFITNRRANVLAQLNALGWTCPLTSVERIREDEFQLTISPNPNSGRFSVKCDRAGMGNAEVEIFNTLGEKIGSQKVSGPIDIGIDLSNRPGGLYFIRLTQNHRVIATGKAVLMD